MVRHALEITRENDFAAWYQAVVKGADMAEASGVRGCMTIKPWGFAMWEHIRDTLDRRIKETGHENCYFPLLIPLELFEKEAQHIEGFAKEMAVVTHHRLEEKDGKLELAGKLEQPLVIRPTSETMIAESFARWIVSHRDLPVKINQWANVMRWEMRPRTFLRTSEFLWQEGHTAHATEEEAIAETEQMLHVYQELITETLCIPGILGKKSPGERFPGAVETYCIEAMMQDGKALQAATSHYLGQNFAKSANITYQDDAGALQHVYTTSWGASSRLIGGVIMVHADDDGLRLPPRIAPQHIVILPVLKGTDKDADVLASCHVLKGQLTQHYFAGAPVRVLVDEKGGTTPGQRWNWVRKGVPLLCEIGPKDLEKGLVALSIRSDVHGKKQFIPQDELVAQTVPMLEAFEATLRQQAQAYSEANTVSDIQDYAALCAYFQQPETGFVRAKWAGDKDDEAKLGSDLGVSIRCFPLEQSGTQGHCVVTGKPATMDAVFAKSY